MHARHTLRVLSTLPLAILLSGVFGAPPGLSAQAASDELYSEVERLGWDLTAESRCPGVAVTVIRAGEVAWFQGCGFADQETETEIQPDTVFNIGSISKTVAAWGVMRLVERGKLEFDAPVEETLTRWHLPDSSFDSDGVTLRRLLSHTAGLSLHGYPGFEPGMRLPSVEESLSGATNGSGDVRIIHEPGSKWKYSGGGFTIAQLLVEEVSGMSFDQYMVAKVFTPLGMEHSDYSWTEEIDALAATPYDRAGQPIGGPRFTAQAAASLQTSSADLARFVIASMPAHVAADGLRLLKPETIELMQTPAPSSPGYGLGYSVEELNGLRIVGHGGANQGWMAQISMAPATGDGIVILTNGSNGQSLIRPIRAAWLASLPASLPATSSGE